MQSLFRIRARLPSGPALTRAALFSRTFFSPRVAAALQARRTLHTSPSHDFPAKATTEKKASSTKATTAGRKRPAAKGAKTTAKKPVKKAKTKPKAKPKPKRVVRVAKKRVARKKRAVKPPRVTLAMAPPRGYPGAFILFHKQRVMEGRSPSKSMDEAKQSARDSGNAWRALSEAEKEPFLKQAQVLREEYRKKREEYFENNDPKILKAINKKRVAKGHNKLRNHRPAGQEPRPLSAYFRFMREFRYTSEASHLGGVAAARTAGERWRAMSEEEKDVYKQAWLADKAEWEKRRESSS
ncbi:HMG box domain-containing protein [Pleurotus pulmonarius]